MGDLFSEASPDARPVDLVTEYLKERDGLPADWQWHSFDVLDHDGRDPKDWNFTRYKGGVYPFKITRGPRKGATNFRKPMPGTERSCIVDDTAFRAWLPKWESDTGKCHKCKGSGKRWAGWHHETGDNFVPCERCGETGEAPRGEQQ